MSIIDDLKRLERLGDENSKTVEKIRSAVFHVADSIVDKLEDIPDDHPLPRGYTIKTLASKTDNFSECVKRRYLVLERVDSKTGKKTWYPILGPYVGSNSNEKESFFDSNDKEWLFSRTPVEVCLIFAKDLADGFLTELADQVEWHTKKANESLSILENFIE